MWFTNMGMSRQTGLLRDDIVYFGKLFGKAIPRVFVPALVLLAFAYFPYDTDSSPQADTVTGRAVNYYDAAYKPDDQHKRGLDYEQVAQQAAEAFDVEGNVRRFAEQYGLSRKRVLDVGSGRGYLQDIVPDYTGLDISETVASRYHKPFVVGSATAMSFPDNSFDGIWSIWVLEHIPQPEAALREMRRVLKAGGVIFLAPAWNATPWAADGFDVRPYSDFNWRGKVIKTIVPFQRGIVDMARAPIRAARWAAYSLNGANTRLHFLHLKANYSIYWEPDSDAVTSLDPYETCLWFKSRGDECLGPSDDAALGALVVRVRK